MMYVVVGLKCGFEGTSLVDARPSWRAGGRATLAREELHVNVKSTAQGAAHSPALLCSSCLPALQAIFRGCYVLTNEWQTVAWRSGNSCLGSWATGPSEVVCLKNRKASTSKVFWGQLGKLGSVRHAAIQNNQPVFSLELGKKGP